ncbi:MAG: type II secretion system protein GspM [Nitrospirota bacterium]
MKKNRTLLFTLPLMAILAGLFLYQYVYLGIQSQVASVKENQFVKTRTLQKYITLIAEKPRLEEKLASMKEERESDNSKLVEGQTLSLAAAALQETAKNIVTQSGGTISSERVGKPEERESFKIITVSIDTILPDPRALRDILYSLETRTPYLTVKEMDIRIRNYRDPREQVVKMDISALTSSR